ncbi:MAG: nucleoside hydrolase [Acidobacteriaceae bacterium]
MRMRRVAVLVAVVTALACVGRAQGARRKVILDQDAAGPGGSNQLAILLALESPEVEVLGITVESGDAWQDEEVAHVLRMLELVGRTDVPVYRGSTYPLVNTMEATKRWEGMYGKLAYKGAWMEEWPEYSTVYRPRYHAPEMIPPMPEGAPHTHAAEGTAADFLVREVHKYPGEVTILGLGPLTNIALAVRLDDGFAAAAKEFVLMGAGLNPIAPKTDEFSLQYIYTPRSNFNFRWDPEAAKIALDAGWKRVVVVPTDATVETAFSQEILAAIQKEGTPAARYIAAYPYLKLPMWDELTVAVWLTPKLIVHQDLMSLDVDTNSGAAGYGDTLSWAPGKGPGLGEPVAEVVRAVDVAAFNAMFVERMGYVK